MGVFPWGKSGRCVRQTTLPPSCTVVTKSGNLNFLEPSRHLRPVMGLITFNLNCKYLTKIILRKIFEPNGNEVNEEFGILRDTELRDL